MSSYKPCQQTEAHTTRDTDEMVTFLLSFDETHKSNHRFYTYVEIEIKITDDVDGKSLSILSCVFIVIGFVVIHVLSLILHICQTSWPTSSLVIILIYQMHSSMKDRKNAAHANKIVRIKRARNTQKKNKRHT